jgi:60 kDa SS-A/Ro ribonucleoprotein
MTWGEIAGVPGLTPRVASAAMAMITAATEKNWHILGFSHQLIKLNITPKMRLDYIVKKIDGLGFGGTDCSIPMVWATKERIPVDAFIVYTDNETWRGNIQPNQALADYRRSSGRDAKSIVVGMTATEFTIADPKDPGMLDVVGFDTATPELMSGFIKGK